MVTSDLRLLREIFAGRERSVIIAPEIQNLLTTLSGAGKVVVMSLYRRGQGPHGMVQGDGTVICRGVDITGYAGRPVTLGDKTAAIAVVSNLISHFPPGRYDLGFPRPSAGITISTPRRTCSSRCLIRTLHISRFWESSRVP
ncbi:MAG TPA: hypothetical protein VFK05_28790 [Polyangiaceae bacterium]|nr:hypothetical protein [Polyangiaceae bacterium]